MSTESPPPPGRATTSRTWPQRTGFGGLCERPTRTKPSLHRSACLSLTEQFVIDANGVTEPQVAEVTEHLGAKGVRARYLLGSKLALDLRELPGRDYETVYRSYGPRSYAYAEMVFGNTFVVRRLTSSIPQVAIHAMRTSRLLSLREIVEQTGLSPDEIRRFNPSLVDRVPARGTLYLPTHVEAFGADVAFWRRG